MWISVKLDQPRNPCPAQDPVSKPSWGPCCLNVSRQHGDLCWRSTWAHVGSQHGPPHFTWHTGLRPRHTGVLSGHVEWLPSTLNCSARTQSCSLGILNCSPGTQMLRRHTKLFRGHTDIAPGHTGFFPTHARTVALQARSCTPGGTRRHQRPK